MSLKTELKNANEFEKYYCTWKGNMRDGLER